ncbi:MAG: flagellar type III secretion system pore protein FliP [Gemmatimonadota bacterium]|nr:flagellar type III secretion system pore protein FliP [Gemmatimonadota bacterium]
MTAGAMLSVFGMLALVLGLLGVALRMLRRFTQGTVTGRSRIQMEVVQRLPLGPRQGLAVVRIGEKVLAVSVGDGGVRPLLQLDPESLGIMTATLKLTGPVTAQPAGQPRDFMSILRNAVRSSIAVLLVAGMSAGAAGAQIRSQIQVPRQLGNISASQQGALTQRNIANAQARLDSAKNGSARVDTMLARLVPQLDLKLGQQKSGDGGLRLSGSVGVIVMMGVLTLLPTLLLMMTGFTRILIVLHFLRQALGTQSAPPAHLVAGMALLITGFVMAPTLRQVNQEALQPWMDGKMEQAQMMSVAVVPFRTFMFKQTRDRDINTFLEMSNTARPKTESDVPLVVLMSAFVTSELRTSFQIGFALFLPFIIIDVVVSSVLMSMGMFMLPPAMVSLPFKLLLFVLVDGWSLVIQSLVTSFK